MFFYSEEKEFLHRRNIAGRQFYSFHEAAPQHTPDVERITLPDDYLTAIYDPPEAIAKVFVVHPSHRYAGVFQAIASGMKYQVHCLFYTELLVAKKHFSLKSTTSCWQKMSKNLPFFSLGKDREGLQGL